MKKRMPIIEGCLEKIADPNNVNYIATQLNEKNKRQLIAGLKGGEAIALTEPESVLTYAFEPISSFSDHLGDLYCSKFLMLNEDCMFNIDNFAGFDFDFDSDDKFVGVVSNFKDGTSSKLFSIKNKYFTKERETLSNFEKVIQSCQEIDMEK